MAYQERPLHDLSRTRRVRDLPVIDPDAGLWHVRVTVAGNQTDLATLEQGLRRFLDASPFVASIRYAVDRAVITYWDEADDVEDAAAMALRVWSDHRRCGLPDWDVLGLEVVDRGVRRQRGDQDGLRRATGDLRPL